MTSRTAEIGQSQASWGDFERLLPANNNYQPQAEPDALIMKRRLAVLQAVEQKVKALTESQAPSRATNELILRVIEVRMSKLRGNPDYVEAM